MYQPCVDLDTMRATGVEALVRWQHPQRGNVMPCDFIPRAEENGDIVPIGAWVLDSALRQAAIWRRAGVALRMSINVSPQQIDDGNLPDELCAALRRHDVAPEAVQIEVTEGSAVRDVEAAASAMRTLQAMGVRLAIDDFGKGYAGIPTFFWLPASTMKIDKSLIDRLLIDPVGAGRLLKALFAFARNLGAATVAEGVETRTQLALLRHLGCGEVQGFLLSPPVRCTELRLDYAEEFRSSLMA